MPQRPLTWCPETGQHGIIMSRGESQAHWAADHRHPGRPNVARCFLRQDAAVGTAAAELGRRRHGPMVTVTAVAYYGLKRASPVDRHNSVKLWRNCF